MIKCESNEMWGCGSQALADARCQSRSVSYQSHVARCPPLHVERSSSEHLLSSDVLLLLTKNDLDSNSKDNSSSKSHHSIASVLPHTALHEAACAARPTPPQKQGFEGILLKTRGGDPCFWCFLMGVRRGSQKHENTPPFFDNLP
jgi:hypothetical protein